MESARLAVAEDLPSIEEINVRRRAEITDLRGGAGLLRREAGPVPVSAEIERHMADRTALVVVGCYDDVVFGYGFAILESLLDGSCLARLNHFVVDSEARKSGIGEAMMNLLLELAAAEGCIGIDSLALPGDRDTKNFFESFGLKARLLTVHRSIDSGSAGGAE
ncbi:MAG: GNAT family N-acetyltransferase [Acidimicrobiales bacterium]